MSHFFISDRQAVATSFLKTGLAGAVVLLSLYPATAQTRRQPNTETLTCAQTHDLIDRFGAINLKSGPVKFDRYVSSRSQCFAGQGLRNVNVPTKDNPRCTVQICAELDHNRN
ncbi:MAG: hypothetical protein JJ866_00100 [Roseibium sp.]|uniref:hypothetical protein n=1 Tax=Roseibium sp. TaxID=1936156 RepID=UPI001B103E43|nr:hypothetical protein [Roseibium sp.]MBO6890312.1 hypothetical protein [Roseibium sp.]